jgi:NTE family protein
MMDDLGVVLSGGGVKGVGHIGFLQALKEYGIEPKYIAGTSAGALVGALYAAGYDAKEMMQFFKETPLVSWMYYSTSKPGLLDTEKYRVHFEKYLPDNSFEDLNKKLFILTTDIENGKSVIHFKGKLINPLMASCSVPLVFCPVEINGHLHSDGGIMNNFPVEPLIDLGIPKILGSYVCSTMPSDPKNLTSSLKVMFRAFDLSQEALCVHKFARCNFVIAPKDLCQVGFLDSKAVNQAYEIGYHSTLENMNNIIDALQLDPDMKGKPLLAPTNHQIEDLESDFPSTKEVKEKSSFSYFDVWPLNWTFSKGKEEKVAGE